MIKKRVTIYDIANDLQVSPSTVSRALNDHYSIGISTKRKIFELAAERGYRPNSVKRVSKIGVIVSSLSRPRMAAIVRGIEHVANLNRLKISVSESRGSVENESAMAKSLCESGATALIVVSAGDPSNIQPLRLLSNNKIPIILVDTQVHSNHYGSVGVDHADAAFLATSHLIDQGCKRIAFFAEGSGSGIFAERKSGYLEALRSNGIQFSEHLVTGLDNPGQTEISAAKLLNRLAPPDGIVVDTSQKAQEIIRYAREYGINVPGRLAVVSLTEDPLATSGDIPLSCIADPYVEAGAVSVREVLDSGNRSGKYVRAITLKARLVQRTSSSRRSVW